MPAPSKPLLAALVAVLLAAGPVAGCQVSVTVEGTTAGACPDTPPEVSTPCDAVAVCGYGDAPCGTSFTCTDGVWLSAGGCHTTPTPTTCPTSLPTMGAPCKSAGQACTFTFSGLCSGTFVATCDDQGQWAITDETQPCTTLGPCASYPTSDKCAADTSCRWLTPGCGQPGAMFGAGCFDSPACATDADCAAGTACQMVDYDPCFGLKCGACSSSTSICL